MICKRQLCTCKTSINNNIMTGHGQLSDLSFKYGDSSKLGNSQNLAVIPSVTSFMFC